jgi:hemerythrin
MDSKYILGIPEMDEQHDRIFSVVQALEDVLAKGGPPDLIHSTLGHLQQLLIAHFAKEESFMDILKCADLPKHRTIHLDILDLMQKCVAAAEDINRERPLEHMLADRLAHHVAEDDVQMVDAIKKLINTLSTHEVVDSKIGT